MQAQMNGKPVDKFGIKFAFEIGDREPTKSIKGMKNGIYPNAAKAGGPHSHDVKGTEAIMTEHGSINPAMCGQALGATRNGIKCP
jgi:hypothetical protein